MRRAKLAAIALLMGFAMHAGARGNESYRIQIKMPEVKDSMVFLAHYYGKGGTTIYKRDSARFKNGVAVLQSTDSTFFGGLYMVLLSDKKTNFEFILNKGDEFTINADPNNIPGSVKFSKSPENERFQEYVKYMEDYGKKQQQLSKQLGEAKTAADTAAVRKTAKEYAKELTDYHRKYVQQYPNTMLANIFNVIEKPQIPEGDHYLEDGKTKDSTFAYRYYKTHFWDGFNFGDDRLIHAPFYDGLIDEYMNKMVYPSTDSIEKECDMLLKKARASKDIFHYTLWWLTRNYESSKIMGMDEVFVYLVENYYMKGDAFWLTNDELVKYEERVKKMSPNVIGNVAPEIKLPNVTTQKEESLHGMKGDYTIVVFYSPNCGHCQHEMPQLDSLYEAVLKNKGVKMFTVATEGDQKAINDFLVKMKIDKKWTNTWDPNHVSDYHNQYDVYSTPTIYILDDKKIIRGKRLDHTNINSVIEMNERRKKDKKK